MRFILWYYYNSTVPISEQTATETFIYHYTSGGSIIGMSYRKASYAEDEWDVYWYEKNIFGDIVAVYNESGTKLISYIYDAWGNFTASYYNGGRNSTAYNNPFRYRGYYYDTDLALYYLNERYYDSKIGRWISPEPNMYAFAFDSGSGLNGYNVYAYCANNPVMFVDPTGEAVLTSILIGAAVGAAIGIFVGGTIGGTIAYNSAKSSGAEGTDLLWDTVEGAGKGAIIGGFIGGFLGAAGGAYAATGILSTATSVTLSAAITTTAKTAELSILQIEKSIADGDTGWQIANDCLDALFINSNGLLFGGSMKNAYTMGQNVVIHKVHKTSIDNLLLQGNHFNILTSSISIIYTLDNVSVSVRCKDPVARANQRSYRLV